MNWQGNEGSEFGKVFEKSFRDGMRSGLEESHWDITHSPHSLLPTSSILHEYSSGSGSCGGFMSMDSFACRL